MKFRSFFWSIIACGLFFMLATSTSKDDEFGPFLEHILVAEATLLDSNLILSNNDTLDIVAADLFLSFAPTTNMNGTTTPNQFVKANYTLEKDGVDTIPLSMFVQANTAFPADTMPTRFELFFHQSDSVFVSFAKDF